MMTLTRIIRTLVLAGGLLGSAGFVFAQQTAPDTAKPDSKAETPGFEGTMTIEKMGKIIARLDKEAKQLRPGYWQFKIEKAPVVIITDKAAGRMRIMVPIVQASKLTGEDLKRIAQANFDTALDSRYAIAREILWSVFIHPLHELHERQFITAVGQTVNLALTYGTTYTSGALSFGNGDSRDIIRRRLIDDLLKKRQDI